MGMRDSIQIRENEHYFRKTKYLINASPIPAVCIEKKEKDFSKTAHLEEVCGSIEHDSEHR